MNCSDWKKQTNRWTTTTKNLELLRNGSLACEHEKQILILPFVSIYSPNLKKAPLGNKLECRSIWMEIQCNFSFCIRPNWFFKYSLHREDSSQTIKSKAPWGSVPLQIVHWEIPTAVTSKGANWHFVRCACPHSSIHIHLLSQKDVCVWSSSFWAQKPWPTSLGI